MTKKKSEPSIEELIEDVISYLAEELQCTIEDIWDLMYIDPDAPIEVGDVVAYIPGGLSLDYNQPPTVDSISFFIVDSIDCDYIWFDNGVYDTSPTCLRTDILDEPRQLFKVVFNED